MKYYNTQVVFEEIPDEITLAINITNCPCHCKGCHSQYLWEDIGEVLDCITLDKLIKANIGITCVCFMGHGSLSEISQIIELGNYVKNEYGLKVGLYSGYEDIRGIYGIDVFDYIKEGKYDESLGGLDKPTTNQRFYVKENGEYKDFTSKFWKIK